MIGFSWLNQVDDKKKQQQVATQQAAKQTQAAAQKPQTSGNFFSWLGDAAKGVAKGVNDTGTDIVNTFAGGTKNLVETGALIPQEIMLGNDLKSGKISKEEYNVQLQQAYDKQPFFKLEHGNDGILHQKQMNPLEFLGNFTKAGVDSGLEIAPGVKAAQVPITAVTKFAEVAPQLLKSAGIYGGLGAANDIMQKGKIDPASVATSAAMGVGGTLAAFPIVKTALKGADALRGSVTAAVSPLRDEVIAALTKNDIPAAQKLVNAAKGSTKTDLQDIVDTVSHPDTQKALTAIDNTTPTTEPVAQSATGSQGKTPAFIQNTLDDTAQPHNLVTAPEPLAPARSMAADVTQPKPTTVEMAPIKSDIPGVGTPTGPQQALDAVTGPTKKAPPLKEFSAMLEDAASPAVKATDQAVTQEALVAKSPTAAIVSKSDNLDGAANELNQEGPPDILDSMKRGAGKDVMYSGKRLQEAQQVLDSATPNTAAAQAAQKTVDDLTAQHMKARDIYTRVANAKSPEDLIVESVDSPKDKVTILDYLRTPEAVLQKVGLNKEFNFLRSQYENYQKELPQEIKKIMGWAKGLDSEANQRIFRYLDGQTDVLANANESRIANEMQTYLKDWANRLGLPADKQISSYITHIFEKDFIKKEFDQDIAKLIQDKVPGSVYNPFLQKRLGKLGYKEDAIAALEAYAKRAVRSVNMNPALDRLSNVAENLDKSTYDYVASYLKRINMQPTKPEQLIDNLISGASGGKIAFRPTARTSRLIRQTVFRATIGGNVGSPIRNLTQGANTYAELGEKYTTIGYTKLATMGKRAYDEMKEVGVLGQDMVEDRVLSAAKQLTQKTDKALFSMFNAAEYVNRGAAYFGAKSKALANGATEAEAIQTAKKVVRDTQFNYGAIDTPVALNTSLMKMFGQYLSYPVKQTEFILNKIGKKDLAGLLRLTGGSLLLMGTIGQAVGMKPDEMLPWNRINQSGITGGLSSPIVGLADAAKGQDEFGAPLSPAERAQNFGSKAFTTLFPGGTEIKKLWQGATAAQQGQTTDSAGRKKYNINSDEALQAILFGPSSTKSADTYYTNKAKGGTKKTSRSRSSKVQR